MGRSLGKGMREFKEGVSGAESALTGSDPSPPAQLPTGQSSTPSAAQVQRDLESLSPEEREAVAKSLASSSERSSAPESERETVS
jgi:Sec-independent protein translocase protein TatA